MSKLNRTALFTATVAIASLSAFLTAAPALAAQPDAATVAARAEHAERMALIGRTPRYDEVAAAPTTDIEPATEAARQQAYVERARLAGRTVQWGDVAPAPVAADPAPRTVDEAVASYKDRMARAGRTVQWNEVNPAATAEGLVVRGLDEAVANGAVPSRL